MEELPLPGLIPDDPQNLLSVEARRRIQDAHLEAEKIRWAAEANIDNRGVRNSKKAIQLTNAANLKAARAALKVIHREYSYLDISLIRFWDYMRQEIEAASNSLELHDSQRRLLETEFFKPADVPKAMDPTKLDQPAKAGDRDPAPLLLPRLPDLRIPRKRRISTTINNSAAAERMQAFIESGALDQTEFAIQAGTTDRTLRSFRRSGKVRRHIFEGIAKAMGLTTEELLHTGK